MTAVAQAIRALMAVGEEPVRATSRKSLKLLGSVGEPINPEAWRWYYNVVGEGRCPIVDTWWQTETGGIMMTPLPVKDWLMKPGSCTLPFFGIQVGTAAPRARRAPRTRVTTARKASPFRRTRRAAPVPRASPLARRSRR